MSVTRFSLEGVAGAWAGLGVAGGACSALSCSRTGPRKQPPHPVEVEAMEQNISRICHKIYFPNDTSEVSPTPPEGLASQAPRLQPPTPTKLLCSMVTHGEPKQAD